MTVVEAPRLSPRGKILALAGAAFGLMFAFVLTIRLFQVTFRWRDSIVFPLVYGAILLAPFVASLVAVRMQSFLWQRWIWGLTGGFSILYVLMSLAGVGAPFVVSAGLLLAAAVAGGER
jgi:hypothetical protein